MNEDTGRGSLTVVDFTVAKAQITKIFVSGAIFGLGIAFLFFAMLPDRSELPRNHSLYGPQSKLASFEAGFCLAVIGISGSFLALSSRRSRRGLQAFAIAVAVLALLLGSHVSLRGRADRFERLALFHEGPGFMLATGAKKGRRSQR